MLEIARQVSAVLFLVFSLLFSPGSDYAPPNPMDVIEYQREAKETEETQLAEDQANAVDVLHTYLATKYDLSEEDYQLGYYVPLTPETTSYLNVNGLYDYGGVWQALIVREGESFYVNVSVRSRVGCDTRQAEAYYLTLEEWVRSELQLPEGCTLDLGVDGEYSGITPANLDIPAHIMRFFMGSEHHPALTGYYREGDLFSPITGELSVGIDYPEGYTESDYAGEAVLAQTFNLETTGDILVLIRQKAPDAHAMCWSRSPTGESTTEQF